jgi:hypothetical protein
LLRRLKLQREIFELEDLGTANTLQRAK